MAFSIWIKQFVYLCLLFSQLSLGELGESNHTLVSVQELSDRVQEIKSSLDTKEDVKASLLLRQLELLMKIAEMESSSSLESRFERLEQTINHTLRDRPKVQAYCKVGWSYFGDSCYLFAFVRGTWEEGRQDCLAMGSDYVKITSPVEFNFCASQLRTMAWIGLNDIETEGQFVWISDGKNDTNSRSTWWASGRRWPSYPYGAADCVALTDLEWSVEDCGRRYRYICEMNPYHRSTSP